jgi:hypothetical protein
MAEPTTTMMTERKRNLAPPDGLSESEKAHWRRVIGAFPKDHRGWIFYDEFRKEIEVSELKLRSPDLDPRLFAVTIDLIRASAKLLVSVLDHAPTQVGRSPMRVKGDSSRGERPGR